MLGIKFKNQMKYEAETCSHNQRITQSIEAQERMVQVSKTADEDFKNIHYK